MAAEGNLVFYEYYRLKATYCDEEYFQRSTTTNHILPDCTYFNSDPLFFALLQDYNMGKSLAYEMLAAYLEKCILDLQNIPPIINPVLHPSTDCFTWTDSKTALIELIYALQQDGAFNTP